MIKQNLTKVIIFLLFCASTASALTNDPNEFLKCEIYEVNECRFKLYDFKLASPLKKAIVFGISLIKDTYSETFGLQLPEDYKVNITILCDKDKFLRYQMANAGEIIALPPDYTGYYFIPHHEIVIFLTSQNSKAIQYMVSAIFHETSHMILMSQIPYAPDWLDEGLAGYFEGVKVFGPDKRVYLDKACQSWCMQWVKKGFPVELDKLISMDYTEFHSLDSLDGVPSYTMGYSLVYFMMSSKPTENILKKILEDMENHNKIRTRINPIKDINEHYHGMPTPFPIPRQWAKDSAKDINENYHSRPTPFPRQWTKIDSVKVINENFPGGFKNFERRWKVWIPNAPEYRPLRAFRNHLNKERAFAKLNDSNDPNN